MKCVKTATGYSFLNLNILNAGEENYLTYYYPISDLITLMAKSFNSSEFIVDFGAFWYLVDEDSITCIMLHEYPKAIKNIKAMNLETKHCMEVFANCGHIQKIKYNKLKYKSLFNKYEQFLINKDKE